MTLSEVAAAVEGTLHDAPDPSVRVTAAVAADSRTVVPGGAFVALKGERVDGRDFAAMAVAAGAVLVLSDRPLGVPTVVVPDVLEALGRWARALLDRLPDATVVAITGSAGKTTAKDLTAAVLEQTGPTIAPSGSFNNELGLPLTVLRADEHTRWLVLEMGARAAGHIAYLCDVAPPTVGVELMVGLAHVGEFGDREAITRAKAELVAALPPDGVAVLNGDDLRVRSMAGKTAAGVVLFGRGPDVDVRAVDVTSGADGRPQFTLQVHGERAQVSLRLVGEHHVTNALAAAAVGRYAGLALPEIAAVLSQAEARSAWRMEVTRRPDGVVVVNDAYNSSPEAVRAALKTLASMAEGRRTWAILGEMRELGTSSRAEHDAVGRLAVRLGISRLVVVGEPAKAIHLGATLEGSFDGESVFVPDVETATELVSGLVRPDDVVLVKASRAVGLERLAASLLEVQVAS